MCSCRTAHLVRADLVGGAVLLEERACDSSGDIQNTLWIRKETDSL